MQLSQFLDLLRYILSSIEKNHILSEYSAALDIINQAEKQTLSTAQTFKLNVILKKLELFHTNINTDKKNEFLISALAIIDKNETLGFKAKDALNKASENVEFNQQPMIECIGLLINKTEQLLKSIKADLLRI